jgi:hypothetical protein
VIETGWSPLGTPSFAGVSFPVSASPMKIRAPGGVELTLIWTSSGSVGVTV